MSPDDDLRSLRFWHPNILVIGSPSAADDLLPHVLSRCRPPVHEICGSRLTVMPDTGTVILRNLADLDVGAQRALLSWLDLQGGRVQVISLAPAPLFPRVADGEFNDALFYRLNVVTMHAARQ